MGLMPSLPSAREQQGRALVDRRFHGDVVSPQLVHVAQSLLGILELQVTPVMSML